MLEIPAPSLRDVDAEGHVCGGERGRDRETDRRPHAERGPAPAGQTPEAHATQRWLCGPLLHRPYRAIARRPQRL